MSSDGSGGGGVSSPKDKGDVPELSPAQQAQAEAVLKSAAEVILPTHKPRDALYGLKSGLYSIGAGTCAGAAALVTAPVVGARTDGWRGFASGLGVGLASAVALPVAGVVNGGRQIVRGCANTAEAIEARTHNKVWDSSTQSWKEFVPYSLPAEAAEVLQREDSAADGEGGPARPSSSRAVVDDGLYQLLGVPTDADAGQIKKAYYKAARKCHPDRNQDDPEAHAKFQALGEAYRVLSSPQLRAHYDKHGKGDEDSKSGMDAEMQMDMAKMFFAVMFGGERFDPYIGTLGVTSVMDALVTEASGGQAGSGGGGVSGLDVSEMKRVQLAREVQCALDLAERLQPFVIGDENGFRAWVAKETEELSRATFGEPLLHAIGAAYVTAAEAHIGFQESLLGIDGYVAQVKQKTRQYGAYADVAKKGYDSISAVKEMADIAEDAKQQAQQPPQPPTGEELMAKRQAYEELSVKELRALCKERDPPVDIAGCLEKGDIVTRVMLDDEHLFEDQAARHAAGEPIPMETDLPPEAASKIQESVEASLPTFLETMVSASLLDVEVTLKAACNKVTADTSVSKDDRLRRAYAMKLLGEAFRKAQGATPSARGEVEAKHVFEGTMMKTMAKAQGQEVHYDDEFISVSAAAETDAAAGDMECEPTAESS